MDSDEVMRAIDDLRSRIEQMEQSRNDDSVTREERIEVADEGELESTEIVMRDNARTETRRVTLCDQCTKKLGNEKFAICHHCRKKLCDECSVELRNRTICPQRLMEIYPLSRPAYKILVLVANGIDDVNHIHDISHIPKPEVKAMLGIMTDCGYIEKSGFFHRRITDTGLEAFSGYSQIYGNSVDMRQLDTEMREFVQGRL